MTAPPAKAEKAGDSTHWYGHTAERGWYPLYTPEKNFTLREARKVVADGGVAVPSVTAYLSEIGKKPVTDWKMEQVAKACWCMPHSQYTDEEAWIDTAIHRANKASHPARDLGTAIHAAVELAIAGNDYDAAMDVYVQPVMAERAKWGIKSVAQEKCVGSLTGGYAGRVDDIAEGMIISDIKSRGEPKVYPTDWLQIAAYGFAEFGNDFFIKGAGIVFPLSTKRPGECAPEMKLGKDMVGDFEGFMGLVAYWRTSHRFDPRSNKMKAAA